MPSGYDPANSLTDMIEDAARINQYLAGVAQNALSANGLLRDAGERRVGRACEPAHRLGERATEFMPGQPWDDGRGMGNGLRHTDDRMGLTVIRNAARNDLRG